MNIYDIAKLSKVSIATVSRVINGSDRVSEKTKKKVEDVMAAYGYKPKCFCAQFKSRTVNGSWYYVS